jgi:hypothetical protein
MDGPAGAAGKATGSRRSPRDIAVTVWLGVTAVLATWGFIQVRDRGLQACYTRLMSRNSSSNLPLHCHAGLGLQLRRRLVGPRSCHMPCPIKPLFLSFSTHLCCWRPPVYTECTHQANLQMTPHVLHWWLPYPRTPACRPVQHTFLSASLSTPYHAAPGMATTTPQSGFLALPGCCASRQAWCSASRS